MFTGMDHEIGLGGVLYPLQETGFAENLLVNRVDLEEIDKPGACLQRFPQTAWPRE
jgi:hypothetical protein